MSILSFLTDAGGIVKAVGDVIDSVTTTDEEKMAINNEMAKAELFYANEKDKLKLEEKKAVLADKDSARSMQRDIITSEHAGFLAKNIGPLLAIATTLLTFVLFFFLIIGYVTDENKDVVLYILGALSAITTQIFSFYFGSSLGESTAKKSEEALKSKV